jgi:hypothetical protein
MALLANAGVAASGRDALGVTGGVDGESGIAGNGVGALVSISGAAAATRRLFAAGGAMSSTAPNAPAASSPKPKIHGKKSVSLSCRMTQLLT